jgi:hypothetical protein
MAGEKYFQVAASNILNASLELQREIDSKRLEISQNEQAFHKLKNTLEQEKRVREQEASRPDIDGIERARRHKQVMDIQKRVMDAEQEFKARRDQLTSYIDGLQREINGLQPLVSDLHKRASIR